MLAQLSIEVIDERRIRGLWGHSQFEFRIIYDYVAAVPNAKLRTDLHGDCFFVTVGHLPRLRKLSGQDIEHMNGGWLSEQLGCSRCKGLGDLARKMRLPACLMREDIKDAECRRTDADGEPCPCVRLGPDD